MIYYVQNSCQFLLEKQIINFICIGGGGSGSTSNCFLQYNKIPKEAMYTTGGGSGQIICKINYELPKKINYIEIIIGKGGLNPILPKNINATKWSPNDIRNGLNGTSTILKINNQIICEALPGFGGIYGQTGGNGYHGGGIYIPLEQTTMDSQRCTIQKYNQLSLGQTIYNKDQTLNFFDNFGGIGNKLFDKRIIAFRNNLELSRKEYNNYLRKNLIFGNGGYGAPAYSGGGQNGIIIFFDNINEIKKAFL